MNHGGMNTPPAVRVLVVGPDQARVARVVARLSNAGLSCDAPASSEPARSRGRLAEPPDVVVALEVGGSWQPTVTLLEREIAVTGLAAGNSAPVLVLSERAGQRRKIDALSSATSGVWDWVETTVADDELVARVNRLARIGQMTEEIRELNRRVAGMETVDRLTGLANHSAFQEYLTAEFRRAERYDAPLSLLLVDLDRFRSLNETHGHPWGDHVLQESARGLRALLREVDMVARFGGEEFALLLPETDAAAAVSVAARVRALIETVPGRLAGMQGAPVASGMPPAGTPAADAEPLRLTASVGVACYPHEATATRSQLMAAAESALRRAKDEGRNRAVLFSTPPASPARPVIDAVRSPADGPEHPGPGDETPGASAFCFGTPGR